MIDNFVILHYAKFILFTKDIDINEAHQEFIELGQIVHCTMYGIYLQTINGKTELYTK